MAAPSDAAAGVKQGVVPEGFTVVREGKGAILFKDNAVFYNQAQVVNRDLSIAALRLFAQQRQQEAAAGTFPKPRRLKASTIGPLDIHSPLIEHLMPADQLELIRKSVATLNAAAEAGTSHTDPANKDEKDKGKEKEGEEKPEAAAAAEGGADGAAAEAKAPAPQPPPPPLRILEALAATGLRALRYVQELDDVGVVVANDLDPVAVAAIKRNKQFAGPIADKIIPNQGDARLVMMRHERSFDVVDLDPYGSPHNLLDTALGAVADGGMLCVTATDMAVLCGNHGETGWTKYGSYPLHTKFCHEQAVRIVLAAVENAAAAHKRYVVPMLSCSIDFYVRMFLRVYTSPSESKNCASRLSYVYHCVGCEAFAFQPVGRVQQKTNHLKHLPGTGPPVTETCAHCGSRHTMGGPIWNAPIHDQGFVRELLALLNRDRVKFPGYDKVHALLTSVSEELPDVPLYYSVHDLCSILRCSPPPAVLMRSALLNAGYRVSGTHASPLGLKTDAPPGVVWDILRCWVKEHPVKPGDKATPGSAILAKEPELEANFSRAKGAFSKAQEEGVVRFPNNPAPNWGPKSKASRTAPPDDLGASKPPPPKKQRRGDKDGK